MLVTLVGYSRAFELAVEGEKIPAARCLEVGLANRVVPADSLADEALRWATKLAQRPTYALGLTKRLMNKAVTSTLPQALDYEAHHQELAIHSQDLAEGVMAFVEKRKPEFQGK